MKQQHVVKTGMGLTPSVIAAVSVLADSKYFPDALSGFRVTSVEDGIPMDIGASDPLSLAHIIMATTFICPLQNPEDGVQVVSFMPEPEGTIGTYAIWATGSKRISFIVYQSRLYEITETHNILLMGMRPVQNLTLVSSPEDSAPKEQAQPPADGE